MEVKMKSVIEDIYYGNIAESIKTSEEYGKICDECDKLYKELQTYLNDKQKEVLFNYMIKTGGLEGETACTHFKEGFKLGLLVAVEAFN